MLDCPPPPPAVYEVVVEDVIDGDTFTLAAPVLGLDTVRLVGVDTPETVDPDEAPERFGKEASEFTAGELAGQTVYLSPAPEARDPYGRLLATAWTSDGRMFNERLVSGGYAEVLTIAPNDEYETCLQAAESRARASGLRMWGDDAGVLRRLLESFLAWL